MNSFHTQNRHTAQRRKQFDYVNPRNRDVQVEMEQVVTHHLEQIGALVDTSGYAKIDYRNKFRCGSFGRDTRVQPRTHCGRDAVKSALEQKTTFKYNVIVVDNHSTDATTGILEELAAADKRLVHIIPDRTDLGIGGCWNVAVDDDRCGRFRCSSTATTSILRRRHCSVSSMNSIVEGAAMIIGSYRMCNFKLETLPSGLIDHREWTDQNGP